MEIRKLKAARGWLWIRHAYQLLLRNPLLGISGALASTLAVFAVLLLPLLGPLLAIALLPIMLAGYMRLCRALEENEPADLSLLLAGFRQHTRSLITLGAMLMLGMFFISTLMVFVGGAGFASVMEQVHGAQDMQVLVEALNNADSQVALALLLGFSLLLVLVVAWQYAPILVFFSGISPWLALQASFLGTLRNIIPYTVYSLIMQLVAVVLGILPYGLGMILLLPLGLVSLYVSYRNIFPWLDEPQPAIPQGD
ncbi:BPSS1780 family membrane protein [Ferrigenium sp. UT5]|uniref:BPSS1780 family membrane protein n=1 Tax=Ferrigenium sp. UT5 TaxID=3242105 RepID=UPI003551E688